MHVVIVVQEARTLGNLFTGWPSAYAPPIGNGSYGPIRLHEMTYAQDRGMCELAACMLTAYGTSGAMDGFERNVFCKLSCFQVPKHPKHDVGVFAYSYLNHREIAPYRALASQYVLADNMYPTEWGGDFTAHQALIAGSTFIDAEHYLHDVPDGQPWGCDAPRGTQIQLEHVGGYNGGKIFPCFTQYPTLADLLDAARLSWKYYVAPLSGGDPSGQLWNAFDAIKKVRKGPDWTKDIISPPGRILTDATKGELPAVAWVIPELKWSDHPASTSDMGPSWVAAIVNAIGKGPQWDSTAIVIIWSEWGGWFDARPPYFPRYLKGSGLGFRVPMIIVSPYSKRAYTSHTPYAAGSILKFIEQAFDLPGLSSVGYGYVFSDGKAKSITDTFDFDQKPRHFVPIAAKYPPSDFSH